MNLLRSFDFNKPCPCLAVLLWAMVRSLKFDWSKLFNASAVGSVLLHSCNDARSALNFLVGGFALAFGVDFRLAFFGHYILSCILNISLGVLSWVV